ncbi:MAG TPA: hypothetical protein VF619_01770 [Allosphingosinicella sp.]|jgi:hypothetical protein
MLDLELEALDTMDQPSQEFWEGFIAGVGLVGAGVAIAVAVAT